MKWIVTGISIAVVVAGVWIWQGDESGTPPVELPSVKATALYDPACGCCGEHIAYMETTGLAVETQTTTNMAAVKDELGVPDGFASCHTTIVEGYVVEGHMPSEAIAKLLDERPDIVGISLPGMPAGSPGMSGVKNETWVIYALEHDGSTSVFLEI